MWNLWIGLILLCLITGFILFVIPVNRLKVVSRQPPHSERPLLKRSKILGSAGHPSIEPTGQAIQLRVTATPQPTGCTQLEHDDYSLKSPSSVLPLHVDEVKSATFSEIKNFYDVGYRECIEYIRKHKQDLSETKTKDPFNSSKNLLCRGNHMLYQVAGVLVWAFGPLHECPTHSRCWLGLLTCAIEDSELNREYQDNGNLYNKSGPINETRSNWSMRALDVDVRVVGLETVVPTVKHIHLCGNDSGGSPCPDVAIGEYFLTIPGQYAIEIRLQGLYLDAMYGWRANLDGALPNSIFLGGLEARGDKYPYFTGLCDQKSFIVGTPFVMQSKVGQECDIRQLKPLPYCTAGAHFGRWIRAPVELMKACSIYDYVSMYSNATTSNRIRIESNFRRNYENKDMLAVWRRMYARIDTKRSKQYHYFREFDRYMDHNICSLGSLSRPSTSVDAVLEVYAPYDLFHGDSMSRNLFGEMLGMLDVVHFSDGILRHMTNTGDNQTESIVLEFAKGGLKLSELYTWNGLDHSIDKMVRPVPEAYITNFAFSHSQHYPLSKMRKLVMNSPVVQFWRNQAIEMRKGNVSAVKCVFSSASSLFGKRNEGMYWMSEPFRLQNKILRDVFINELNFSDFDEYLLTAGKPDFIDGWHYYGVTRRMAVTILLNLLCS